MQADQATKLTQIAVHERALYLGLQSEYKLQAQKLHQVITLLKKSKVLIEQRRGELHSLQAEKERLANELTVSQQQIENINKANKQLHKKLKRALNNYTNLQQQNRQLLTEIEILEAKFKQSHTPEPEVEVEVGPKPEPEPKLELGPKPAALDFEEFFVYKPAL